MHLSLETLRALRDLEAPWCVSLSLPTAWGSEDPASNDERLVRCWRQARSQLESRGVADVGPAFSRAAEAVSDPGFWNRAARGLAMFLTPSETVTAWLPVPVPEQVEVARYPRLAPLLRALAPEAKYFILALAAHDVRFFEASRTNVRASMPEDLPRHIDAALPEDDPEPQQQVVSAAGPQASGIHYGHGPGDDNNQDKDERLGRFFRKVEQALHPQLRSASEPLVLAGDVTLLPVYRSVSKYAHVLERGIEGNPEQLRGEELRDRAWPLVEPIVRQREEAALEQLRALAGSGRTAYDVGALRRVAEAGGIEQLFLSDAIPVDDEVDRLVLDTAGSGGAIHFAEPARLPDRHALAAILRKGHEYAAAAAS
jgi:hypothetical protein